MQYVEIFLAYYLLFQIEKKKDKEKQGLVTQTSNDHFLGWGLRPFCFMSNIHL